MIVFEVCRCFSFTHTLNWVCHTRKRLRFHTRTWWWSRQHRTTSANFGINRKISRPFKTCNLHHQQLQSKDHETITSAPKTLYLHQTRWVPSWSCWYFVMIKWVWLCADPCCCCWLLVTRPCSYPLKIIIAKPSTPFVLFVGRSLLLVVIRYYNHQFTTISHYQQSLWSAINIYQPCSWLLFYCYYLMFPATFTLKYQLNCCDIPMFVALCFPFMNRCYASLWSLKPLSTSLNRVSTSYQYAHLPTPITVNLTHC